MRLLSLSFPLIPYFSALHYRCHAWTKKEKEKIKGGNPEKALCEAHTGRIFTNGNEALAPGCGTCKCCKPGEILYC